MQHRLLVDVVRRPEYVVRYEQVDDITFIHADVHHWSAAVARRFRGDITAVQELLGQPLYAIRDPERPNLAKFLALHGFHPCGHVNDVTGRVAEIYERTRDGQNFRWWHAVHQSDHHV